MLTAGYSDEPRLPQNDLVYVAFRVCYFDLLSELDSEALTGESDFDDGPYGFLTLVPFFRTVPARVQLDLLGSVWAKHHAQQIHRVFLLNAAVLWAVLNDAGTIGREVWENDLSTVLDEGPRRVTVRMDEALAERWKDIFDDFWDDIDFLSIEDMQDLPPDRAKALRATLDIPEEWVDEMFAVLDRTKASESILENLRGLLTDEEIEDHRDLLLPSTE